jgi:hypothetical protein
MEEHVMGWLDWFIGERKKLLDSDDPIRAFAPDPDRDYWPLAVDTDNEDAYAFIKEGPVHLVWAATGESTSLSAIAPARVVFATMWDTYSAQTIGTLKAAVDEKRAATFGIVLFENSRDEVVERKQEAWYFARTLVLAPSSEELRPLITRVPFQVLVDAAGRVERIIEGRVRHIETSA